MARADVIVLGAGIVGVSAALQFARRGLSVAIVDRGRPGEETSYGNAGIIEGNTIFPPGFPLGLMPLARIAFKRATEVNYHIAHLPKAASWLWTYRRNARPAKLIETALAMRPLFARAVAEHETLAAEAGATGFFRRQGWLKLYRSDQSFDAQAAELRFAAELGVHNRVLSVDEVHELEPGLNRVFRHAVHWAGAVSVTNPLGLTRAYARRLASLGGIVLHGDAHSLHRAAGRWRVDADEGPVDAANVVVALGPWAPDLLERLGLRLPMAMKRGYHLHFRARGNVGLRRPVLDADRGYCIAPMEQGIRLTTGAEFARRDARSTPVQLSRVVPAAQALFPLGEEVEAKPWLGSRPIFPDSRPVIGSAPGQPGLWLAIGHAHWGLTLGPATGRLLAEMIAGEPPFCDPAPYRAARFGR